MLSARLWGDDWVEYYSTWDVCFILSDGSYNGWKILLQWTHMHLGHDYSISPSPLLHNTLFIFSPTLLLHPHFLCSLPYFILALTPSLSLTKQHTTYNETNENPLEGWEEFKDIVSETFQHSRLPTSLTFFRWRGD